MTGQDLLNILNLYLGKFSGDTTEEQTQKLRALDSAKNILLHQLGLPYSEKLYYFNVFEGQEMYPVPDDFLSPISLYYDDSYLPLFKNLNERTIFSYEYPEKIVKLPKTSGVVYWSIDLYNPSNSSNWERSIIVKAPSVNLSNIISNCDNVSGWSTSDDASNLTIDNSIYKTNGASLRFLVDEGNSANSYATIKYNSPTSFDFSKNTYNGVFSFDLFIPYTTGITNIVFKWGKDSSNYWFYIISSNSDGTFYDNSWNKFLAYWNETTSKIGSPSSDDISYFEIQINYNESSFVSPQNINLDYIVFLVPDKFVLRYYSTKIVKNNSGTLKEKLENTNDTLMYAVADPTLGDLTAKIASYIYSPLNNRDMSSSLSVIKSLSFDLLEPYFLKYPVKTPQNYRGSVASPRLRYY